MERIRLLRSSSKAGLSEDSGRGHGVGSTLRSTAQGSNSKQLEICEQISKKGQRDS